MHFQYAAFPFISSVGHTNHSPIAKCSHKLLIKKLRNFCALMKMWLINWLIYPGKRAREKSISDTGLKAL